MSSVINKSTTNHFVMPQFVYEKRVKMQNLHKLFNSKALLYAKNRPSYSHHIMNYLNQHLNLHEIHLGADVGAGTGQMTKILADNFNTVYGIEPNLSMLNECKKQLSSYNNIIYKCCSADNITIAPHSLDYITVAQAFHLFYNKETYFEFKRILKHNGKLIIIYNMKNHQSKLFLENEKVLLQYCPLYNREFHATEFNQKTFFNIFKESSYDFCVYNNDNTEYLDWETFVNRTLSSSYSITSENPFYEAYIHDLKDVFERFAVDNKIKMELSSVLYSGILR